MDLGKFLELTGKLSRRMEDQAESLEKLQRLFDRFHLLNRSYLDKETFEQAKHSIPSIAETIGNTIQYLDSEIAHLRNKRMKLPFENVALSEMQKVQSRNEMLLKEYLSDFEEGTE